MEDIQRGAVDLAFFEHLHEVVLDQVFAPAHVDQMRMRQKLGQRVAIEDADGVRRKRQDVHQEARAGQECRQGGFARKGFHAGDVARRPRPARHGITELGQGLRHACAHLPQPQHAHRPVGLP